MQLFQIVKNTGFPSSAITNSSEIEIAPGAKPVLSNNYFVYKNSIGGDVVSDNNVRDFLDKDENTQLAEDFVKYLEQNTDTNEFKNIFYDNKKLSSVFNEFYRKKYINKNTQLGAISKNLQNTKSLGYKDNNFKSSETRLNNNKSTLIETGSSEQNYYINIKIDKKINILPKGDYSEYFEDCIKGTYFDKDYIYTNSIIKQSIFGNIPYIKNQQNNIANNFGYAPVSINSFNQNFIGNNTILPGQGRGDEENIYYYFYTFNRFSNFFNYLPPKLTGTTEGIFINQVPLPIEIENRKAKFILNPIVEFNKNNTTSLSIPITIERFILSASSTFFVKYEKYSNAILGKTLSFTLGSETELSYLQYNFSDPSESVMTKNIFILKDINPEDTIVLSLTDNKTRVSDFLIIRCENFIQIDSYTDNSYILTEKIIKNKLYLNCFVDYNYDDKDMDFYRNNDIKVVNISQESDTEL